MSAKWYDEYFDEVYLELYGSGLDSARHQVGFIVQALGLPPGAAVLDLACGPGRHSLELARLGYRVTGLDRSRPLLEKAEELSRQMGVSVEWVHEDMRTIPETWAARFDAAINVFTSWGYFETDAENEKVLQDVARSLGLGGRFLLDAINHEYLIRHFRPTASIQTPAGLSVLDETRFDALSGRVETERRIVFPDGRQVDRRMSIRLFTLAEVRNMLERCGMKVIATYGDFEGLPYDMDSRRMIVVAERER